MTESHLTNYDHQATNFAKLPEYSLHCGTDYLAVKEAPAIISQLQPMHNILDLGCGSGLATRFLKKHFPSALIIGADINKSMLEQAAHADPSGLYIHLPHTGQGIFYPFLHGFFDVIVCSFVIHENKTVKELELFFSHIANMLRPGGLFLAWDVYKNLFHGNWLNIKKISHSDINIHDEQRFIVKILPAEAEVTGTYWSPETLSRLTTSFHLQTIEISYPLADPNDEIHWQDETRLAPYYVLAAKKHGKK